MNEFDYMSADEHLKLAQGAMRVAKFSTGIGPEFNVALFELSIAARKVAEILALFDDANVKGKKT